MRPAGLFFLLVIVLPLGFVTSAEGESPAACVVPPDLTAAETPLPALKAAIRAGEPVEVLAVGSGTTVSPSTEGANESFPLRMIEALRKAEPKVDFELTVLGGRGVRAADMLAIMRTELARTPYRLVLWQTGTVEAVRGESPEALYRTLAEGAQLAREKGADLVLIDPQFSRFLRANANLDPYEAVFERAATLPGVMLFRRYDLMRGWVAQGTIDLERTPKSDEARIADLLHRCLGQALAAQVLKGAEMAAN